MKTILYAILTIALVWLVVCSILPFWSRYRINTDLDAAALYGTKHSIEDTTKFFSGKLKEKGYAFDLDRLHIEKDEENTVSISWTYQDTISYFGLKLKSLTFTLDVTKQEVETAF